MAGGHDEKDLMSIGQHCNYTGCHQLDFLPFKCKKCSGIYCVEHRREQDHSCTNTDIGNKEVPECPLCGQLIVTHSYQSANDQVERHLVSGCKDHILNIQRQKSHKCKVKNCRDQILIPFTCSACHYNYCIRHRHSADHQCNKMTTIRQPIIAH